MTISCLYVGAVSHRRLKPKAHRLRYRLFQLYLDLDEAEDLSALRRLFGFNRPALFSFHERDHLDGDGRTLKAQVAGLLAAHGIEGGGAVRVLCLPRVLGFVFNPISLFFCHRPDGTLSAVIYEVNNTFGDRHAYVLRAEPAAGGNVAQGAKKALHVSPFMAMEHDYRFRLNQPAETFTLGIQVIGEGGAWLSAGFSGKQRPLTDAGILAAFAGHPLVTFMVVAGIHYEALKLWAKGLRYYPRPAYQQTNPAIQKRLRREFETIPRQPGLGR